MDEYQISPQELMPTYYYGYLNAINELLVKIKDDRTLFFPLTFLLSHYMELWIKTMGLYYGLDFNFDMKGLGITGHNIRELIIEPQQFSEFSDRDISTEEIEEVLKIWEYFERFAENDIELSIAMRYPVMSKGNSATIKNYKNYEDFDADAYINMGNKILNKTSLIYIKFIEKELIDHKKRLLPVINLLKNKEIEFDEETKD